MAGIPEESDLRVHTRRLRSFTESREWQQFHTPKNLAMSAGIEAAHIKSHQAGVSNGLGLCSLHHKLLDRGPFRVEPRGRVVVSEMVNGGQATEEALIRFHGEVIRIPRSRKARPDDQFLEWHRAEVFRGS